VSTRPVAPEELSEGWEKVNPIAIRMDVPGGWIYDIKNSGPVFVPKPVTAPEVAARQWHEWEGQSPVPTV
jgi:hypothetical protein